MDASLATLTANDVLALLAVIAFWTITYFATYQVIVKAGFSGFWVLLPISPAVVYVIGLLVAFNDASNADFFGAFRDFEATVLVVLLLALVNWALFLVFAFRSWPALDAPRGRRQPHARPGPSGMPVPMSSLGPYPRAGAPAPGTPTPVVPASGASAAPSHGAAPAASAAAPGTLVAPVVAEPAPAAPRTFFCSWCGKERSPGALAIHHCGSRDRPAAFCSGCGQGLEQGESFCVGCGTPSAQLSPP